LLTAKLGVCNATVYVRCAISKKRFCCDAVPQPLSTMGSCF